MTLEPTLGIFVERRAREHCKGIHSSSFTLTEPSNGRSPLISPSDVRMYEETQIFREFFKVFPLVFSGEQITNTIDYSLPRKMFQKVLSIFLNFLPSLAVTSPYLQLQNSSPLTLCKVLRARAGA